MLFQLGTVYAQASAAMKEAADLKAYECDSLSEHYAARAVELLDAARQLGYFRDPAHRRGLATDRELDSLRGVLISDACLPRLAVNSTTADME